MKENCIYFFNIDEVFKGKEGCMKNEILNNNM